MEKRIISTFFLLPLALLLTGSGSGPSDNEKLKEVYGAERIEFLKKEHPEMYDYLLFKADHSYELIRAREGKDYQEVQEVAYYTKKDDERTKLAASEVVEKLQDGSFNPFKCHLDRKKEAPALYELKGTGKVLKFLSEDRVAAKYEKSTQ